MRILAGADFHGNLRIVGWFVEQARALGPEAVVLAGDLLGFANEVEDDFQDQRFNAQQVVAELLEVEAPIFYIMGNDDLIELEPVEDRLVPVHNRRAHWTHDGFRRRPRVRVDRSCSRALVGLDLSPIASCT